MDIKYLIEQLVAYAERNRMIDSLDVVFARNALLDLFKLQEPYSGVLRAEDVPNQPFETLDRMIEYAYEQKLIPEKTSTHRDLLDAKIMGLLMPGASETARRFWHTAKEAGARQATDDFYKLSIDSNYIRMDRIRKNEYWTVETGYGDLEITINLSKPEKDPKDIIAERNAPKSNYPKCLLCLENLGYAGRINHPARQNLRVIPVELQDETWYMQYSPYVYYNEHSIVFSERHVPMRISAQTFRMLLDFVDRLPHYFVGSNADLPIVGGSILQHNHFQGGRHVFAMETAAGLGTYRHPGFGDVRMTHVKWPLTVLRLASKDRKQLEALSGIILDHWRLYSDEKHGISASSPEGEGIVPHNTITPIARRNANGEYELDLVLRNNRTDEDHPYGIFHPPATLHHIKKENIGLIEVMGLAVLPDRLLAETEAMIAFFLDEERDWAEIRNNDRHGLNKHAAWMQELFDAKGQERFDADEWRAVIREQIGRKFAQVLEACGVFKQTESGLAGLERFARAVGFDRV